MTKIQWSDPGDLNDFTPRKDYHVWNLRWKWLARLTARFLNWWYR